MSNSFGTFYSVGVGPGDPLLMTLKAINIIKQCEVIAVPITKDGSRAFDIADHDGLLTDKFILKCDLPMTRDRSILKEKYEDASKLICEHIKLGKSVAFLTIGDPTIYSTAMYMHSIMNDIGIETVIIPGVPSFCSAAASLNTSLCERDDELHIIPASSSSIDESLSLPGVKVFMKAGKQIGILKEKLTSSTKSIFAVSNSSLDNEVVYRDIGLLSDDAGYFSIIIVKDNKDD